MVNLGSATVTFRGGAGSDRLIGGRGIDRLYGDAGDDALFGNAGDDLLEGGDGNDQIQGGAGNDRIFGHLQSGAAPAGNDDDVIFGDAGDDVVFGGPGNDRIVLGAGADWASGGAGDDLIDGGTQNDVLFGDAGDDRIVGGDGDDFLDGGAGADEIQGGRGNDRILGGTGADLIWGGLGNDWIDAGDCDDIVFGGEDGRASLAGNDAAWGSDTLIGGLGNDLLYAGSGPGGGALTGAVTIYGDLVGDASSGGADVIHGGPGNDQLWGGGGNDAIYGHGGNDRVQGDDGNDAIDGGDGHDLLIGGAGADQLTGGAGSDVLWGGAELVGLSATILRDASERQLASVLMLPPEIGRAEEITEFRQPRIVPALLAGRSARDDVLDAADEGDLLLGGADRDWIFGGAGDDMIDGGDGEDYLDGGAGKDVVLGGASADVVRGGDGDDLLRGGSGADLLYGEGGSDRLYGDEREGLTAATGAAALLADPRRQRLYGGDGDDFLFAWSGPLDTGQFAFLGDALFGGRGNDHLYGAQRRDVLFGGEGNDVLIGDALAANVELSPGIRSKVGGRDLLYGEAGDDVLQGGGSVDDLYGGGGNDRLEGQRGSDLLVGGAGSDVLVVDLDPAYGSADVDRFDGHGDPLTVDNGIDRFLIAGTDGNDRLLLAETLVNQLGGSLRRLVVSLGPAGTSGETARANIDWRVPAAGMSFNSPRLEQFHLLGLGGDDEIRFAEPGELGVGTVAVDLSPLAAIGSGWVVAMEGGGGDDVLHGTAFRDYIDGGPGSDRLFGGDGDDQLWGDVGNGSPLDVDHLFGGRGNDDLYGGTGRNEMFAWSINPYKVDDQGRYVDDLGQTLDDPWDASSRVWLGVHTETDPGTGAERPRQGPAAPDTAPESTGLNRVIGGAGDDMLFGGRGLDFLSGGGGSNAFFGRQGQALDAVGNIAFNADPERSLDPQQASGYWHYAASNANDVIRVDFVTEPGLLTGHHLITRLTQNGEDFSFDASVRLDFSSQTAGSGGRPLWTPSALLDGMAMLVSGDVDSLQHALGRGVEVSRAGLISTLLPPEDDFLAIYVDAMDGDDQVFVGPTVQKSVWVDAGAGNDFVRIESGNAILIDAADRQGNSYAGRNDSAQTAFRLLDTETESDALARSMVFTGLTLDNPQDLDFFAFGLQAAGTLDSRLLVRSSGADDRISLALFAASRNADGVLTLTDTGRSAVAPALGSEAAVSLAGLAAGEFVVRVADNRIPTRYELVVDLADGTDLTDRRVQLGQVVSLLPRRDLILGGDGNDVLIGGPGEDYVAGGPGNDVLSGGADRQAVDVLDGGEGDDTFQIWTDAPAVNRLTGEPITVPGFKSEDLYIGGEGIDRALFLGTDAPDFAAIRYNAQAQRYEVAARVYDVANQRFLTQADGSPQLEYAFFALRGIEAIQVELRDGDDEFHADPGYRMAGDPDAEGEWGMAATARPLGAPVDGLTIFGGNGNDRLFGGAGRDWIDGGAGRDVIAGGPGDDELHGGEGDDLIAGDKIDVLPDAFESGRTGDRGNDNLADAHLLRLSFDSAGRATVEGSFHAGDGDDWYLIEAPIAPRGYGSVSGANPDLERVALDARSVSVQALSGAGAVVDVFAAKLSLDAAGRITSIDRDLNDQLRAPSHYLVRVANVTRSSANPQTGSYRLTIDASAGVAAVDVSDARQVQRISWPNAANVLLPAGDLDGDGRNDYLATLLVDPAKSELRQILSPAPSSSSPWITNSAFLDITATNEPTVRLAGPLSYGVDNYSTLTLLEGGNFDRWDGRNAGGQIVEDARDEVLWVETVFVTDNDIFDTRSRIWLSKTTAPFGLDPVTDRNRLQLVAEFWGAPVAVATLGDVDRDEFVDDQGITRAGVEDLGILAFQNGHAMLHLYSGRGIWTYDGAMSQPSAVIDLGVANIPSAFMWSGADPNYRVFDAGDIDGNGQGGDLVVNTSNQTWFLTAGSGWQAPGGGAPRATMPEGVVFSTITPPDSLIENAEVFRAGDVDRDGRQDYVLVEGSGRALTRGWSLLRGSALVPGATPLPAMSTTATWYGAVDVVPLGNFLHDAAPDFAIVGRAAPNAPYLASIYDGSRAAVEGDAASPTLQVWLGVPASSSIGGPYDGLFAIRPASGPLANWVVPLGEVNADGRSDLAVATGRGGDVVVYLGNAAPLQPSAGAASGLASQPATRPLAGPAALPLPLAWTTPTPWTADAVQQAPTAYGSVELGQESLLLADTVTQPPSAVFARPVAIGDFNGDGHGDFVLPHAGESASATRIVFGPVTIAAWDDVDDLGDHLLPGTGVVVPDLWGNVDRDAAGTNDLVWAVKDSGLVRINVRFGGAAIDSRSNIVPDRSFLTNLYWQDPNTNNPWDFDNGIWTRGVQISVGDWDGDGYGDIMVKEPTFLGQYDPVRGLYPQPVLTVYSGREIASNVLGNYEHAALFRGYADYAVETEAPGAEWRRWAYNLDAQFVGDVNGDGRVDLVVASPVDYRDEGNIERRAIGGVYLFLGDSTAGHAGLVADHRIDEGQGKGGALHRLGDVNGDGLADFAISSYAQFGLSSAALNNFELAQNQVELFLGSDNWEALSRADSSFIGQFGAPGTFSRSTVTVGDFNADGRTDLAVGTPVRYVSTDAGGYTGSFGLLSLQLDGRVDIWYGDAAGSLWNGGAANAFRPASLSLAGRAEEMMGVLWNGPAADVDGDGIADLLIGRPGADRLTPSFLEDAGGFTLLRGFDGRLRLTTASGLPANAGSLPAVAAGDQTIAFAAGQVERWFRFTTEGDGVGADGFIALTGYDDAVLTTSIVRLSADWQTGTVVASGRWATLAGLPAGTYLLRVQRPDSAAAADVHLQASLPLSGRNLAAAADSDRLWGGGGNDYLVGGADVDRLYGGLGNDRFNFAYGGVVRAAFEARDQTPGADNLRTFSGGSSMPADLGRQTDVIADPVIHFAWNELAAAMRAELGLPPDAALRESQVLGLTKLRVTMPSSGYPDMAGLERLVNLRYLVVLPTPWEMYPNIYRLDSLGWVGLDGTPKSMRDLPYLRTLFLDNHALTSVDAALLPDSLEHLWVNNNRIASLHGLTGRWAADDDFGNSRYTEDGSAIWLLGRASPAVDGDYRFTDGSVASRGASAQYRFAAPLPAGSYRLHVTWPTTPFNALIEGGSFNAVRIAVFVGDVELLSQNVDQKALPEFGVDGRPWFDAGVFNLAEPDDAQLRVLLKLSGGETLLADAVMLERLDSAPRVLPSLRNLYLVGNPLSGDEITVQGQLVEDLYETRGGHFLWINLPGSSEVPPVLRIPQLFQNTPYRNWYSPLDAGYTYVAKGSSINDIYQYGSIAVPPSTSWLGVPNVMDFTVESWGSVGGEISNIDPTYAYYSPAPMLDVFRIDAGGAIHRVNINYTSDYYTQRFFTFDVEPSRYRVLISSTYINHDRQSYFLQLSGPVDLVGVDDDSGSTVDVSVEEFRNIGAAGASPWHLYLEGTVPGSPIGEVVFKAGDDPRSREVLRIIGETNVPGGGGLAYGTVYADRDLNGLLHDDEAGIEGLWVGVDFDGDGSLANEPRRIGAWTDYRGRYVIDLQSLVLNSELPDSARLAIEDSRWREFRGSQPSFTETWLGPQLLRGLVGPWDLGVVDWGLPALAEVADGQYFELSAPSLLYREGIVEENLIYEWRLYEADESGRASTLLDWYEGNAFTGNLPHRADGYVILLRAGHFTGPEINKLEFFDNISVRVITHAVTYVSDFIWYLGEGETLRLPLRPLVPFYSNSLDPAAEYSVVTVNGPSSLDAGGTGYMYTVEQMPSGEWDLALALRTPEYGDTEWVSANIKVRVANLPPVVNFPAPSGDFREGTAVILAPAASDPGGDILAFNWTVTGPRGQLYTGSTPTVSFVPLDQGTYTVSFTASDTPTEGSAGLEATAVRTVTVKNAPPKLSAPTIVGNHEGQPIVLTAVVSDPGVLDTHSFSWIISSEPGGAGTTYAVELLEASGRVAQFVPPRDGRFYYNLVAVDNSGSRTIRNASIFVNNLAPILQSATLVPRWAVEGDQVGYVVDASDVDPVTYTWSARLGNVQVASGTDASFSFAPPDQGDYTVSVTVRDTQGATATMSAPLSVANAAPVVPGIERLNFSGNVITPVGTSRLVFNEAARARLHVVAGDVAGDALAYRWTLTRLDTGTTVLESDAASELQLPLLQAGLYVVRVTVSDEDGAATTVERTIDSRNLAPTWVQAPPSLVQPLVLGAARLQSTFSLRTLGSDPVDVLTARVEYGDGVARSVPMVSVRDGSALIWTGALDHTYTTGAPSPQGWQVAITVTDEEGPALTHTLQVPVIGGPRLTRTGGEKLTVSPLEGDRSTFARYQVSLDAAPVGTVRVELLGDRQLEFWNRNPTLPDATRLTFFTFDANNWTTPRSIFVSARDDSVDEADILSSRIVHRVTTTDPRIAFQLTQDGGALADLIIDTRDNDRAGVTVQPLTNVSPSGYLITDEAGRTARFSVQLLSQPSAEVVVDLNSSKPGEGRPDLLALRFTPQDWNVPQEVVVTGVGDNGATSASDRYQIEFALASGDPAYQGLTVPSLLLINVNVEPAPANQQPAAVAWVPPVPVESPVVQAQAPSQPLPVFRTAETAEQVQVVQPEGAAQTWVAASTTTQKITVSTADVPLPQIQPVPPAVTAAVTQAALPRLSDGPAIDLSRVVASRETNPLLGAGKQRAWLAPALMSSLREEAWPSGRADDAMRTVKPADEVAGEDRPRKRARGAPDGDRSSRIERALAGEEWL
jgi:Ca2+-binding RTX toxin-like protein